MSDDVLVRVEGVSKKFCRSLKRSLWYGMQDTAADLMGRGEGAADFRPEEFWAVDDVSFELKRGECLGLIGRNGAGKTTLLKMLNGLIKPDKGRIEMRGRIGALIALGAGFNPILTGRENIYVNGAVLGLSKREIDAKIDEIIDFAEIGTFIDAPVQSYSSGMQVRLGFAVATAMKPDVVLLDEVLAVGDTNFRHKCYNRIGSMLDNSAVILVTHNMQHVAQLSQKVLVLKSGSVGYFGSADAGIDIYDEVNAVHLFDEHLDSSFDRILLPITEARFSMPSQVDYSGFLPINCNIWSNVPLEGAFIRFCFYDEQGQMIAEWDSSRQSHFLSFCKGENVFRFSIGPINLRSNRYFIGIQLHEQNPLLMPIWSFKKHVIAVRGKRGGGAPCQFSSLDVERSTMPVVCVSTPSSRD